jgi:(1->4)-alpha-D-glucan 1-alpha-D-glucosylmutase
MNAGFTLADARKRVGYFERLGISHLYLSPILAARRGSMHGYDVVDPARINPELGTEADLRALADDLHARQMGLIVDIVPNHMGIGPENPRWEDVLTHGERSRYARWFDIDWSSTDGRAAKVVLPVLGDDIDRVLERGELSVTVGDGDTPRLRYLQQSFPLDPATLPPELQLTTFDAEETGELAHLFSGRAGRDRLRALLDDQHYRLVPWRELSLINYRRFFDVNDLAAVRAEDPAIFEESHALTLALVRDGVIDGLRIDHVDGLADPRGYLERLRAALPLDVPVFVEKILTHGEHLRDDWPVDGTTGYEFLNDLEDVFIDPAGFARIDALYRRFRHLPPSTSFRQIARQDKIAVLRASLSADVKRLVSIVLPLPASRSRRFTAADLESAIVELIASLPVYRTYIDGRPVIHDSDRAAIECAVNGALASGASDAGGAVRFIADLLLGDVAEVDPALRLRFVARFQQLSGPAMAKGVEDTALYVYVPLVSRNEVGGAPDHSLQDAVARFHAANQHRGEHWPRALNATNTHDTKRSADVRARLDALSECATEWERAVRRWRRLNARHRMTVKGRLAPDTNTAYLIYQTLVALWPGPRAGRRSDDLPDRAWRDSARMRLVRYALKAAREAKTRTSWVAPNTEYENALNHFVGAILEPADDAPFLTDVARLVARIAPIGAATTLARVAIHLTAPGTPDIYQGDEQPSFTLVDPDNRAQVDFDGYTRALDEVESAGPEHDGTRPKLSVVRRLLALRAERGEVFREGSYTPIAAVGEHAGRVVAFAREHGGRRVLTVAARLSSALGADGWSDTRLELPSELRDVHWRMRLTSDSTVYYGTLHLATLLRTIPVAVLAD